MNYTLISHKQKHLFAGVMDSTQYIYYDTIKKNIIKEWANLITDDFYKKDEETFWKITLLVDGVEALDECYVDIKHAAVLSAKNYVLMTELAKRQKQHKKDENS